MSRAFCEVKVIFVVKFIRVLGAPEALSMLRRIQLATMRNHRKTPKAFYGSPEQ